MKARIPIARPDIGARELKNVMKCVQSGWISQGPFVQEAQERLQEVAGRKYVICCSSGTTALLAALMAIKPNIRAPWRVACPAMTFAAVHNAIKVAGGEPYYLDANPQTWQVSNREWESREYANFDAAIAAPCYGGLAGTLRAESVANIEQFPIIEDAAESFGGYYAERPAGSFGDVSCISFYANKIVTAGEGGAILTDDETIFMRSLKIINHGMETTVKTYKPDMVGLNGRMTDMQAAVLCAQLDRMPEMVGRRQQILGCYRSAAKDWKLPKVVDAETPAPWMFAGIPPDEERLGDRCIEEQIEWRPFFPLPDGCPSSPPLTIARHLSEHGVCLPLSSAMTDEEVERVVEVIRG